MTRPRSAVPVLLVCAAALLGLLPPAGAVRAQEAADHLSVPGPIRFDGVEHRLAWSAKPRPGYIKQEYLPAGQTLERFEQMLLVEVLVSGTDAASAAAAQVRMVNQRKAQDPVANVAILRNPESGELIVDFILSATVPSGDKVIEWSAYRYLPKGKGVLMFGVSRRAYGEARTGFMQRLKTMRPEAIRMLAAEPAPDVQPSR